MTIDEGKLMEHAIREATRDGIAKQFANGYSSPLGKLLNEAIEKHSLSMRTMLEDAIASCINEPSFRDEIATAVRHSLAKTLIQRFGGEMEKQVNVLKSDPTTRARITLAIEEIVKSKV